MNTTARTVNDIAEVIREIDGDNAVSPSSLGYGIAGFLIVANKMRPVSAVVAFVERTNPDKALTPDRLAELIVAEFELDKED